MNEVLQHLRRQRRWRWSSLVSDVVDHEPNQERQLDYKELLEHALARLEPELRSLYLLREVEEKSYAEIAEITQLLEGTVASRLNRARQLLKQHLLELGWEQSTCSVTKSFHFSPRTTTTNCRRIARQS